MSILSFPDRGPWGKSSYRGNASGHIYKALYEQLKPRDVVEVFSGSGTAKEVAEELGIPIVALDLKDGFDATKDSILEHVGHESDLVFGHGPYGTMISYSGHVWGDKPHPADLSHIEDIDEFIDAMQAVLLNQREATRPGGVYGTLTGDIRKGGRYTSLQAEYIARMPRDELKAILIKTQHNTVSGRKSYGKMRYPFIEHEYILLWEKTRAGTYQVLAAITKQNDRHVKGTWKAIIRHALTTLGGEAPLERLYEQVAKTAPTERLASNENWQAKIRQVLQRHRDFHNRDRGVWALA